MKILMKSRRAGFTLIELVGTLALSGMVLVFTAMLLSTSTNIYVNRNYLIEDSQKIQIAMNRLIKELNFANYGAVATPNSRTVQWTSAHPNRLGESLTATWDGTSGSDLYLEGVPLLNNVDSFSVSNATGAITFAIRSTRSLGVVFSSTVYPRDEF